MREGREITYEEVWSRHQDIQELQTNFSIHSVMKCLSLSKITQARAYMSWCQSRDYIREASRDGILVFYSVPVASKWLKKKWVEDSGLPNEYWNGAASRAHWFNSWYVEGVLGER